MSEGRVRCPHRAAFPLPSDGRGIKNSSQLFFEIATPRSLTGSLMGCKRITRIRKEKEPASWPESAVINPRGVRNLNDVPPLKGVKLWLCHLLLFLLRLVLRLFRLPMCSLWAICGIVSVVSFCNRAAIRRLSGSLSASAANLRSQDFDVWRDMVKV